MTAFLRWKFVDPYDTDPLTNEYIFPRNPRTMTNPFPQKNISVATTTAVGGKGLLFEGNTGPYEWSFGGDILEPAHYEALRSWTYDRMNRIYIDDHFGRRFTVVLQTFSPEPKRAVGKYWRHTYQEKCIVVVPPTAPTVGEVPV